LLAGSKYNVLNINNYVFSSTYLHGG
jgi:hypothetical protein